LRGFNERKDEMSNVRNELKTIQKSQEGIRRKIDFLTYGVMFITSSITTKETESSIGRILGYTTMTLALIGQIAVAILDIKETIGETDEAENED
jgi:hypothetical protein